MLFTVYYEHRIRGKYYRKSRIIEANTTREAEQKLKAKFIPGYDMKPYHVHAEPKA